MLLLDALYICESGGLRLLMYLVRVLQERNLDFYLLADNRAMRNFGAIEHVSFLNASLRERKKFYERHKLKLSSVLCFGNIPAPIKMNVPVYTYFHNINLLTLSETHSTKEKIKSWLKREVFKFYKNNTDYWLVQTSNTSNELIKHLNEKTEKVKLMPFYELSEDLKLLDGKVHGYDYIFVSDYTGAKGHEELLEAWRILHQHGINRTLHLTAHERNKPFIQKVKEAQDEGVSVVNHGFIPFHELLKLYQESKAIIYPSHNESLGLGIVEAITSGCDVLGSDLPYIYSICKPSGVFNPYSPESIVAAVEEYEKGETEKSKLLIYNHIDELIDLLCRS